MKAEYAGWYYPKTNKKSLPDQFPQSSIAQKRIAGLKN